MGWNGNVASDYRNLTQLAPELWPCEEKRKVRRAGGSGEMGWKYERGVRVPCVCTVYVALAKDLDIPDKPLNALYNATEYNNMTFAVARFEHVKEPRDSIPSSRDWCSVMPLLFSDRE
jgi:hypothetical protein